MLKFRMTKRDKVARAFKLARSRYGALVDKREGVFIGAKAMGLSGQGVDDLGLLLQRKGSQGTDSAKSINAALQRALNPLTKAPYLGFPIITAQKGPGSVENGVVLINSAYGSGALFMDESCESLATSHENWVGGEGSKDANDAFRYVATPDLEALDPGVE